jgi:Mrp family chromosome partitioning ATPase/capsular polysaccharide biosynthesis protein
LDQQLTTESFGIEALRPTVLSAMRRHGVLVGVVLVVCAVLGGLAGATIKSKASATASIVVQDPSTSGLATALGGTATTSPNYVQDQAAILKLPSLAKAAADKWNTQTPGSVVTSDDVEANLTVKPTSNSDLIEVTYKNRDGATAAGVANAVVAAYEDNLRQRSADRAALQLTAINKALAALQIQGAPATDPATQDQRTALLNAQARAILQQSDTTSGVQTFSPATVPGSPSQTNWLRFGLLGLIVGLIPAAVIAYAVSARRRRFSDRFQPEVVLMRPLITEVPSFASERLETMLPTLERPASGAAEAFRFVSTSLSMHASTKTASSFAVVSGSVNDGKTTVAANLALTAAQDGRRVLLIDADLQGHALTRVLLPSSGPMPGLVQLLEERATLAEVLRPIEFDGGVSIDLLPGGLADHSVGDLFSSGRAATVFAELTRLYDLVLVDTAPVLQVAYTSALLKHVDQVLAVVPHGSNVARLEELDERLTFLGVTVAGYVYTKAPLRPGLGRNPIPVMS